MNANQRRLKTLYEARDHRLLSEVPDSTIRRQIEKGVVRDADTLYLYELLGMPLRGWVQPTRRKRIEALTVAT